MKRIVLFAMVMGMMIMGSSCVSSSGNLYSPSYEGDSQFTSSSSSFDHNYQRRHKKYCEERGRSYDYDDTHKCQDNRANHPPMTFPDWVYKK